MEVMIGGEYRPVIVERKRIKNMYLRINEDGSLHVTCSRKFSDRDILLFIREKERWIMKTEAEQKDISVSALTGSQSDEAYWLGKKMKVIKGPSSRSRVLIGEDTIEYGLRTGSEEEIARLFYRAAARQTAAMIRDRRGEWDEKICRLNRITLPDISVRYMTSRWGSCTPAKGTIRISSRLMHFPPACLDYVLLHEYTHLLVPNHSKKFWDIVEYYMPDYKEHQDVLKHAG
jgi:predicted metal-dependent hydrolase